MLKAYIGSILSTHYSNTVIMAVTDIIISKEQTPSLFEIFYLAAEQAANSARKEHKNGKNQKLIKIAMRH